MASSEESMRLEILRLDKTIRDLDADLAAARRKLEEAQDANLRLSSGAVESRLYQENTKLRADLAAARREIACAQTRVYAEQLEVLGRELDAARQEIEEVRCYGPWE